MSLRGRYIIDRVKRFVSPKFRLPVPPYGDPSFWESVYQRMETATAGMAVSDSNTTEAMDDSFEWGGFVLDDVVEFNYKKIQIDQIDGNYAKHSYYKVAENGHPLEYQGTLSQALGVLPISSSYARKECETFSSSSEDGSDSNSQTMENEGDYNSLDNQNSSNSKEQPILILGCGNSKLGEDMIHHGWQGPIVQVDIAAKALELIARRSHHDSSKLQFVQDDATQLSSFHTNSTQAAIDKGLLDALFCANEYEQCTEIMNSVLRVLQPGGSFCIFSFSRPEFLLPKLVPLQEHALYSARNRREYGYWDDLEMKELERILLYRFIKSKSSTDYYNQGGFSEPKRVSSKAKRQ